MASVADSGVTVQAVGTPSSPSHRPGPDTGDARRA
ncbi:hypothetical protein ABH937_001401 [Kitasatospora sp. GAS1066B]